MSSEAVESPPFFENTKDEMENWENLTVFSASKGVKKDSLDPLDFTSICEDIQGLLMQHFSGKDLLKMSEVSKAWNNLVRAEIPKKTILNLSNKHAKLEDIEVFSRSNAGFKQIVMSCEDFGSVPVSLFSGTVEKLKIIKTVKEIPEEPLEFSKLKSLELHFTLEHYKWFPHLQMDELEELKIANHCDGHTCCRCNECVFCSMDYFFDDFHRNNWLKFFKNMKSLKRLDLGNCRRSIVVISPGTDLQLETLRFRYPEDEDVDEIRLCRTLKSLTVIRPQDLKYVFANDLSNLITLELEDYDNQDLLNYLEEGDQFPCNNTIKNLSIKFEAEENINFHRFNINVMEILETLPQLETFYVSKLTLNLIKFVARRNLNLKTVKYIEIEDGSLEKYEKMKQTQQNINREIQFIHEN